MPTPPKDFRGTFRSDSEACAVYSESAGIARAMPRAVSVPVDVDDLCTVVRWASSTQTPLIPRGSGSSMPNGAIGDGVIVDLSRWRNIISLDPTARVTRMQPGVLRDEIDAAAKQHGLRFPVDPSSGAFCTIGGMASTNAAGAHSMHFGSTRPWVRALDCVFADGSRAEIRRGQPTPRGIPALERFLEIADDLIHTELGAPSKPAGLRKNSSGYALTGFAQSHELVDLLVGSEGTLVFFVEIELDLIPAAAATSSVLGAFASLDGAVAAAVRARDGGAVACELLDRTFLDVAASGGGERPLPANTESALMAEVEGDGAPVAATKANAVAQIFRDAGATTVRVALDAKTEHDLWELRHAASPILAKLDARLRSMQFIEDCVVPPDNLAAYVRGIRDVLAANDTRGVIFGHAGDAHVHVNPLVDMSRADWRARVEKILDDVVQLAARLGGTLSGEHGDGRLRTPLLDRIWTAGACREFAAVKAAFDPLRVLNPGVKVPLPGERAIVDVRYDPALPPLPPRATAALARVDRDRAYSQFRLDLLGQS